MLPFSRAQFLEVFAAFNNHLWPLVILLWVAAAVVAYRRASSLEIRTLLAVLWVSSAVYHAFFFAVINPVARIFAAAFLVQAALLLAPRTGNVTFSRTAWRSHPAALVITVYGLAYPAIVLATGERYPFMPAFGVPCPTALVTIGLLLTAAPPAPRLLLVVPLAWCVLASSAAVLLGIRADFMLIVAGLLLAVNAARRPRTSVDPAVHGV